MRAQTQPDKSSGTLSVRLFSDQFVAGVAAPEVNPGNLEELTRISAKGLE